MQYTIKRLNFITNAKIYFAFLHSNYGYNEPIHVEKKQENGFVLSDELSYSNINTNRIISLKNSYHPVDYGFELCVYNVLLSTLHKDRKMVYYILKEDQDVEQTYLEEAAVILKENYIDQILDEKWFYEKAKLFKGAKIEPTIKHSRVESKILNFISQIWSNISRNI